VTPVTRARFRRKPPKAARRGRGARLWPIVQIAFAVATLGSALLAVLPPQSYRLFQARLTASEGSAWVMIAALLALASARPGRRGAIVASMAVVSIAASSVPILRAYAAAATLRDDIAQALGPLPARLPAAMSRKAPVVLADLVGGVGLPEMQPRTMVYATIDGRELLLDILTPPGADRPPAPGVLVIHGGGWAGGARTEFSGLARYLASRGYVVISMDYRLAPVWRFPAARDDVASAVQAVEAHAGEFGMDPHRLALLGRSAGGQLALLHAYAAHDPAIRGVVSFYGPTDLVYGYEHPADLKVYDSTAVLTRYIGGPLADQVRAYRAASPIEFAGAQSPPTLLVHGVPDELVEVEQSRRLDRRLTELGVKHVLVELPWASHACDYFLRGPCGQVSTFAVEQFLARILAPA
jgi:acetyl esterase/lipase